MPDPILYGKGSCCRIYIDTQDMAIELSIFALWIKENGQTLRKSFNVMMKKSVVDDFISCCRTVCCTCWGPVSAFSKEEPLQGCIPQHDYKTNRNSDLVPLKV